MKIIFFIFLFLGISGSVLSQNSCNNAFQYCGNNVSLPLDTTGTDLGAINCLNTAPNATWFYFEVNQDGDINTQITGANTTTGSGLDIDVIVFGPLVSLDCIYIMNNLGSLPVPYCNYSTSGVNPISISSAQSGEVYVIVVTNFSNQSGEAEFLDQGSTAGFVQTNCITSIAETNNNIDLSVLNPFQYNLEVDGLPNEKHSVSIYDLTGRKVYTEINSISHRIINLSNLSNGTYILEIIDLSGKKTTRKIIKH